MDKRSTRTAFARHLGPLAIFALLPIARVFAQEATSAEALPVIALPTGEAPAPQTGEAPAAEIETVVVTGEKLGRTLQQTTSSVGIATRAQIEASSAAAMKDIVGEFGNVVSAEGDREIAIRGVPQTGIGGEGETISVYLDGVALPSRAANFAGPLSAWDLEQVEVLRGAQSTNQGRNSLAGSVVLRSVEPTPYWDAKLRAGLISRGGHDYALAGGGPLGDTLAFRVAAQDRDDPGDIHNTTRDEDDAGREKTRNWRGKLAWTPDMLPGYRLQYGYTQADNEYGDSIHDASNGDRRESSNVRGLEDITTRVHGIEQRYDIDPAWRVEAISGWVKMRDDYRIDYDRSAADGGYSDNTNDEDTFSQELRVRYNGERLHAVAGLYYADSDNSQSTVGYDVATAGGAALLNGFINSDSSRRTGALFAEADWDFARDWRLTFGGRYNDERYHRHDVSDLSLALTVPPQVPLPLPLPIRVPLPDGGADLLAQLLPDYVPPDYDETPPARHNRDFLPKLGLSWRVTPLDTVSLTYQEGYRSGGASVSFFGGAVSEFDPEYTQTLELAARTRWFDERLTVNANVFYTRWRDMQVTVGDTTSFYTTTENAGRSHLYGMELEAAAPIAGPLQGYMSLGLLDSEFDEFSNQSVDYAGNEFPDAPHETVTAGLRLREWNRLSGQLSATWIATMYSDPSNDDSVRIPSRTLINAKLGYRLVYGVTLSVYGRNIGNDLNLQGRFVSGDRVAAKYGEARSFGALLEWQL